MEYSLEADLRKSELISSKVKNQYTRYGQRLYATLCNNDFMKNEVWPILQGKTWACSWRYAGGIVSDIVGHGDYIDYYCSGNEGVIDQEVREDLLKLGWLVKSE